MWQRHSFKPEFEVDLQLFIGYRLGFGTIAFYFNCILQITALPRWVARFVFGVILLKLLFGGTLVIVLCAISLDRLAKKVLGTAERGYAKERFL